MFHFESCDLIYELFHTSHFTAMKEDVEMCIRAMFIDSEFQKKVNNNFYTVRK